MSENKGRKPGQRDAREVREEQLERERSRLRGEEGNQDRQSLVTEEQRRRLRVRPEDLERPEM